MKTGTNPHSWPYPTHGGYLGKFSLWELISGEVSLGSYLLLALLYICVRNTHDTMHNIHYLCKRVIPIRLGLFVCLAVTTTYYSDRKVAQPKVVENDTSARAPSLTSASCNLNLWPPDPQSWSFHALAPRTTCSKINSFSKYRTHLNNRRTDGRTDRLTALWGIIKA